MRITRENYEAFLVDFAEGVLSDDLKQEVKKFLILNPDIQEKFDMFTDSMVETVNVNFEQKESLKKIPFEKTSSSSEYFQRLCVAHIEGLNSDKEESFLNDLIERDKEKKQELELYEKTKLIIEQFNFNEKLILKQPEIIHQISEANFEEYCIACMEGWLDQRGMITLNDFIAEKPERKMVLDAYLATRLKADFSTTYPDKRKIKRFNILSPEVKKYASIISSAAAILVLGFMVFYATTVDDTTQIASSVVTNISNKNDTSKFVEQTESLSKDTFKHTSKTKSVLKDPFRFKKVSARVAEVDKQVERENINLEKVEPIVINEIACTPCKNINEERALILSVVSKPDVKNQMALNTAKESNYSPADHVINLAQTGLEGLGKLTNTKLKIKKTEQGDKTKIAFNSKFISFSTQINRKN